MKFIFTVAVLLTTFFTHSQSTVYKTFEDYQNGIGEHFDEYKGFGSTFHFSYLVFKRDSKKIKVKYRDVWGFTIKDAFFRMNHDASPRIPLRVLSIGEIVYYENGPAYMEMIRKNSNQSYVYEGFYCYISQSINSKVFPMPYSFDKKETVEDYMATFLSSSPQYKKLFYCIGKDYNVRKIGNCVKEFEND